MGFPSEDLTYDAVDLHAGRSQMQEALEPGKVYKT